MSKITKILDKIVDNKLLSTIETRVMNKVLPAAVEKKEEAPESEGTIKV
jgi:hypothetical protein